MSGLINIKSIDIPLLLENSSSVNELCTNKSITPSKLFKQISPSEAIKSSEINKLYSFISLIIKLINVYMLINTPPR